MGCSIFTRSYILTHAPIGTKVAGGRSLQHSVFFVYWIYMYRKFMIYIYILTTYIYRYLFFYTYLYHPIYLFVCLFVCQKSCTSTTSSWSLPGGALGTAAAREGETWGQEGAGGWWVISWWVKSSIDPTANLANYIWDIWIFLDLLRC